MRQQPERTDAALRGATSTLRACWSHPHPSLSSAPCLVPGERAQRRKRAVAALPRPQPQPPVAAGGAYQGAVGLCFDAKQIAWPPAFWDCACSGNTGIAARDIAGALAAQAEALELYAVHQTLATISILHSQTHTNAPHTPTALT